jgi:hypothetical protein
MNALYIGLFIQNINSLFLSHMILPQDRLISFLPKLMVMAKMDYGDGYR